MAEDTTKKGNQDKGLRSRLPKFLTDPITVSGMAPGEDQQSESAGETKAALENPSPEEQSTPSPATEVNDNSAMASSQKDAESTDSPTEAAKPAFQTGEELSSEDAQFQYLQYLVEEVQAMQTDFQKMHRLIEDVSDRESSQEKIFNTLHAELRDYKNDFIYEHLKPMVRPLLFLYDALEQFDAEIALYERPNDGERRQVGLSPQLVRENIAFFRDQLVESLRICEVTPMDMPKGAFNPRLHKVIDVVPVDEKQDGMIQRVVRSGWYLNSQLLRSAEVIVGKKMS